MYTCVDINNSDHITGQLYSLAITTTEEIIYIRAETKEERESWLEILGEYPEMNREAERQNKKKKAVYPMTKKDLDTDNSQKTESSERTQVVIKQPLSRTESDINKIKKEPSKDISRSISCPPGKSDADPEKSFSDDLQKVKDENHNRSWSDGYGMTSVEKDVEKWLVKRLERPNSLRSTKSIELDFSSSELDSGDDQCFRSEKNHSGRSRESSLSSPSPRQEHKKNNEDMSRVSKGKKKSSYSKSRLKRSASARHVRDELEETGSKLSRSCSAKNVPKNCHDKISDTPTRLVPSDACLHRNNNNVNDYSRLKRRSNRESSSGHSSPINDSQIRDSPIKDSPVSDSGSRKNTPTQETQRRNSLKLIEQGAENDNIHISTEELNRIDASSKSKFKFNKSLLDGESPSPSRRTIERRRHAQERKGRHTLDGSLHVELHGEPKEEPKLKRSNSDPNLSEADDMLKRKEIAMTFPGLFHLKKGWLIKQGESEQDWSKHWFVLCDNKLTYYKDQQAEEESSLSGVIELANCIEACSTTVSRNYGFEIQTENYSIILAAMTSGIKNNWVQAINKAIATARSEAETSSSPIQSKVTMDEVATPNQIDAVDNANVKKPVAPMLEIRDANQQPSRKFVPDIDFMLGTRPLQNLDDDDADTLDDVSQIESDIEKMVPETSTPITVTTTEATPPEEPNIQEVSKSVSDLPKKSRGERKHKRPRVRPKTEDQMKRDIEKSMKIVKEGGILRSKSSSSIDAGQRPKESKRVQIKKAVEYTASDTTPQEDYITFKTQPEELLTSKDCKTTHVSPDNSAVYELLETEVESLKEQLTSTRVKLESSNQHNIELNAKIDRLKREHQNEMSEVMTGQSAYEAQLEKLRQKKNILEEEKQRMIEDLKQKEVDKINLQESNEANRLYTQEFETLQNRCSLLASELEKCKEELNKKSMTMKLEREKVTDMIEKLNDRIDGLEEEVGDKKVLLQEAESQATIKAKQVRELETLLRQSKSGKLIEDLMAELTDTRSRLEESETVVIQNDERFEKRYLRLKEKMRAENDALKNQLQLAEEKLKMSSDDDDMIHLVTHKEVVACLKNELELTDSAKLSLQQKCADLQNELAQIVLKGQGELASVQSSDSAMRLEEDLEETRGQLKFLKEALENEKTSGANLSVELENERKGKAELLKEFEELSEKLKQQETKVQTIMRQSEVSHEDQNKKTEAILQKEESELFNSQQLVNESEFENMRAQLDQSKEEIQKMMELIVENGKEKEIFVEKLNLKDKELQQLQKVCEKIQAELDHEEKNNGAFETKVASLKTEIDSHEQKHEAQSVKFHEELQQKDIEILQANIECEDMQKKWNVMKEAADLNIKKVKELEMQAMQQMENMQVLQERAKVRAERGDRDNKKLRAELKEAQDSFDELELKHIQTKEDFKKLEKSQAEQILLMGSRIKDLTTKLAAAERKVRDANRKIALEQKSKLSKSRPGSRELEIRLKDLETQLEDVEMELEVQEKDSASLEGKIKRVSDSLKNKQGESELVSSSSLDEETSEEPESSVQDFNGSVSSPPYNSGFVGFKLNESEEKLKEVTRKLVDLTARELDNRKSYQAKCASERVLKQEIVDLKSRLESMCNEIDQFEEELVAQEKIHRVLLEEQTSQYRKELEELKDIREKELEEEAAATAKAISALKRVHLEELQRERLSVGEMMSDDVESVMKRHREVVNRMEKEWHILSEKYSSQCQENRSLQKMVENLKYMMKELQKKKDEIAKQNLEMTTKLEKDVGKLMQEVEKGDKGFDENDVIQNLQIKLRIKEIELKCSMDEMQKFKSNIDATKEENKELQQQNKHLESERHHLGQRIDVLELQVNSLKSEGGRIRTSGEGAAAPEGSVDCEEVFESPVSSPGQFDSKYNAWFPPECERHPYDSSSSTQSDSSRFSSTKIEHV
ncbi:protein outspread-like isoform X2 [Anneissia japonica]|nr:protein outspread-like isoform X2 [Anneissia japonica]